MAVISLILVYHFWISSVTGQPCEGRCPSPWILHEQSCFAYFPLADGWKLNFNKAREMCQDEGGDLAMGTYQTTTDFLRERMEVDVSYWAGFWRQQKEGSESVQISTRRQHWVWVDSTNVSFNQGTSTHESGLTQWHHAEPSTNDTCGTLTKTTTNEVLLYGSRFFWLRPFICEKACTTRRTSIPLAIDPTTTTDTEKMVVTTMGAIMTVSSVDDMSNAAIKAESLGTTKQLEQIELTTDGNNTNPTTKAGGSSSSEATVAAAAAGAATGVVMILVIMGVVIWRRRQPCNARADRIPKNPRTEAGSRFSHSLTFEGPSKAASEMDDKWAITELRNSPERAQDSPHSGSNVYSEGQSDGDFLGQSSNDVASPDYSEVVLSNHASDAQPTDDGGVEIKPLSLPSQTTSPPLAPPLDSLPSQTTSPQPTRTVSIEEGPDGEETEEIVEGDETNTSPKVPRDSFREECDSDDWTTMIDNDIYDS